MKIGYMLLGVLAVAQFAFAAEMTSTSVSTPPSNVIGYGVQRFFEAIDLAFTFDQTSKANKISIYARKRLAEAAYEESKGNGQYSSALIQEYSNGINDISTIATDADRSGDSVTGLRVSNIAVLTAQSGTIKLTQIRSATDSLEIKNAASLVA